jgi:hypothetical protein
MLWSRLPQVQSCADLVQLLLASSVSVLPPFGASFLFSVGRRCCVWKASRLRSTTGCQSSTHLDLAEEDRGWEVVSLGDDPEVAINGLELTPRRRGGDRATTLVSGRGREWMRSCLKFDVSYS